MHRLNPSAQNPTAADPVEADPAEAAAAALFAQRRYAYAVTDRHLRIQKIGGVLRLLYQTNGRDVRSAAQRPLVSAALWDVAPELRGYEREMQALLDGTLARLEIPTVDRSADKAGSCYVTLVNVPHVDGTERITGILHCVEDVTEAVRLHQRITQQRNQLGLLHERLIRQNQELAAANAELQRLDEMKSLFVSIAAHELRTPLSAVVGYTELLQDESDGLTPSQQHHLALIANNARRLHALTNSLLDLTRLEAGQIVLQIKRTDFLSLVEDAAEQLRPALEAKQQRLHLDATPGLPAAHCDPERALQILTNLLSNAHKYTPEHGSITLRLMLAERDGYVQVAIADTGMGIPEADRDRLFDRFFRASNAGGGIGSGAGLGLYIVQLLVDLHGGEVWFESEVGRGTTFYVTFPSEHGEPQHSLQTSVRSSFAGR